MARTSVLSKAARVEPRPADRQAVEGLRQAVAGVTTLILRLPNGHEVVLPPDIVEVLQVSADQLSAGHAVMILASEVLLTPAEVGELLGVSRPYVARLLDQGLLPSERLPGSRHRVVPLADVLEFQQRRERRRQGRKAIADVVDSEQLPY